MIDPEVNGLDEYQIKAASVGTWAPGGSKPLAYYALKLNGEAGEVAEIVGKAWRGDYCEVTNGIDPALMPFELDPKLREKLVKELGDVLWYVAKIAGKLGVNLSEVGTTNLRKLIARIENVEAGLPAKSGDGA